MRTRDKEGEMYDIRQQNADAQDRNQMDNSWQEELSWMEATQRVPVEKPSRGEGLLEGFERNPMLWSLIILGMGSVAFILMTVFLN
jgi:hypothetical protein